MSTVEVRDDLQNSAGGNGGGNWSLSSTLRRLSWYLFIILVYPLGYSFWLSFHDWTLRNFVNGVPFVGLQNYIDLFSNPDFVNSLRITFTFVISAIAIEFTLGMGLALLLNRNLFGKGLIRSMVLLPMMCTNVVIGLTWRLLFNYQFGIINYYLGQSGLRPVEWLSMPRLAMVSVDHRGRVEHDLLRGADAAGRPAGRCPKNPSRQPASMGPQPGRPSRYITLPLLRQTILVALLWRLIDTFRIFDVIYLLTAGGPARATETVSIYVYNYGFKSFNLGYASAASYVMILIMLVIAGHPAAQHRPLESQESGCDEQAPDAQTSSDQGSSMRPSSWRCCSRSAPILYLLITSFKPPELTFALPPVWIFTPTLQNYQDVFVGGDFTKYFINSVVVALFHHLHRPGAGHLRRVRLRPLSLPGLVLAAHERAGPADAAAHHHHRAAVRAV